MFAKIKRKLRAFTARNEATILTYHSVVDESLPFPIWQHLERDRFEQQLAFFVEHFNCITLSQLRADMARGRMQPYSVVLTFDDGFRNNLVNVLPLLQKYRVPMTLFVTTGTIGSDRLLWPEYLACVLASTTLPMIAFAGKQFPAASANEEAASYRLLARTIKQMDPDVIPSQLPVLAAQAGVTESQLRASPLWRQLQMLTWDEVRRLASSDLIEIGSHTVSHWRLTNLNDGRAQEELTRSKATLESEIGPIRYFAYPHGVTGDFSETHRTQAVAAGYEAIFTAFHGTVTSRSDPTALPRLGVGSDMTLSDLDYLLHGGLARMEG